MKLNFIMKKKLPIEINRYKKKTFTTKRDNYKSYNNALWKWDDIFSKIESENKKIKEIAEEYNIKYKTLLDKYKKFTNDKLSENYNKENRGGTNKIFTVEEERELSDYIKILFIKNDLYFDDDCLRIIALKKYKLLYLNNNNFNCSKGWIYYFKKRWKLTTKNYNYSKKTTKKNQDKIDIFLNKCLYAELIFSKEYIFNLDETFWRIINNSSTILSISGEDRKLNYNIDPKTGYTAIFIISANGYFFKPTIIMKGTTSTCLNKIKIIDDYDIYKKYTKSGWIDENILLFLLREIAISINYHNCTLILDNYSVHKKDIIIDVAGSLNIKLIFVPPNMTPVHQPLDVKINGPVKSIGKYLSKELFLEEPFSTPSLCDSILMLIESIKRIKSKTIIDSFVTACHFKYND